MCTYYLQILTKIVIWRYNSLWDKVVQLFHKSKKCVANSLWVTKRKTPPLKTDKEATCKDPELSNKNKTSVSGHLNSCLHLQSEGDPVFWARMFSSFVHSVFELSVSLPYSMDSRHLSCYFNETQTGSSRSIF